MLIMTGTGMLTDIMEGPFGLPYEIFKWTLVAKFCRVKVLFVSVGVGPLQFRLGRWFVKLSLYAADYVGFRDLQCRRYMTNLGFHKKSLIFPDLAFSLPQALSPIPPAPAAAKSVIGVGLYDYRGRGMNSESDRRAYQDYLEKIGDFIKWLIGRDYAVRVLIGDIAYDSGVRDDLQQSLRERGIGGAGHQIIDEPISSISDLFGQIDSTDIIVASRFHNIIISLILGKPVIGISYHNKIDALMADTGLSDYCVAIEDFGVAGLIEKIGVIQEQKQNLPCHIRERTQAYHQALEEQYRLIFSL
jgi:polysaccharide pyruvyl transferase WcaK-like protein